MNDWVLANCRCKKTLAEMSTAWFGKRVMLKFALIMHKVPIIYIHVPKHACKFLPGVFCMQDIWQRFHKVCGKWVNYFRFSV